MMRIHAGLLLFALMSACYSADPSKDDDIKFPEIKQEDPPVKQPLAVTVLPRDQVYPIVSKKKLVVIPSMVGYVKVNTEVVPPNSKFRFRAYFVDGKGIETREWVAGKEPLYLHFVEPLKQGPVELIILKEFDGDTAVRKGLSVMEQPRPPPVDPPVVDPPVVDPLVKKVTKVIVVVAEDAVNRTVEQAKVLNDKDFRDFMKSGGHHFELVSIKDPIYKTNNYDQYAQKVGLPAVLIFNAAGSSPAEPLDYFKLPAQAFDLQTRVKKVIK